jgi:hypothetical protein
MKNLSLLLFTLLIIPTLTFSQKNEFNLETNNLHKKVRKTTTNYFTYDDDSGGFILRSTSIKRYNDDGNLIETLSQYNDSYTKTQPTKKLYNYNNKKQLINIQNISSVKNKYSFDTQFIYNSNGNKTKKESVYSDGRKFYLLYEYDRKNKLIKTKSFSTENKLTSETDISYDGKIRKEKRTSYNAKDGSIFGTYETVYKNDVKTAFLSNSKYAKSKTTYKYNNEDDIVSSNFVNKTSTISTYNYEYDRKDNWIKKHYRSGKYQYFYFREILFDNGDTSGSISFDNNFINRHGNFTNVAVVPIKMKKIKKKENDNTPYILGKNFNFQQALIANKLYNINGGLTMSNLNLNTTLKNNDLVFLTITIKGKEYKYNFNLTKFTKLKDKYEWEFKNQNGNSAIYSQYKKETSLKDKDSGITIKTNGVFSLFEVEQPSMIMYLK